MRRLKMPAAFYICCQSYTPQHAENLQEETGKRTWKEALARLSESDEVRDSAAPRLA